MEVTQYEIKEAIKQALREEADRIKWENTCPNCYENRRPSFYVEGKGRVCIKCWLREE